MAVALKRVYPLDDDYGSDFALKRVCFNSVFEMDQSSVPLFPSTSSSEVQTKPPAYISATFPDVPSEELFGRLLLDLKRAAEKKDLSKHPRPDGQTETSVSTKPFDTKTLTLSQVRQICARFLREREAGVRTHYDQILNGKLADQYEQFVQFAQAELRRQKPSEDTSSYYS